MLYVKNLDVYTF